MSVAPNKLMSKIYQTGKAVTDILADIVAHQDVNNHLLSATQDALLNGGKRLRPFLVVESARVFGVHDPRVLTVAGAIECIHCYSLVHDDLPAMDDDSVRRGQPTIHVKYDEATAILVGDGLQSLAFEILSDPNTHKDPCVRADLCLVLARASGCNGMVGGQMLDVLAEQDTTIHTETMIRKIQSLKTGCLIHASVEMGAILGNACAEKRDALRAYGDALGRAFQISDDILDALGDSVVLGKKSGKDAHKNKATFVSLLGTEGAKKMCLDTIDMAKQALDIFGTQADTLRDVADFVYTRDK